MSFFRSGEKPAQADTPVAASGVTFQTAVYGKPITLLWGTDRISCNYVGFGNFQAVFVADAAPSGGGKGGSSAPPTSGGTYVYYAGFMAGLCEGPILGSATTWVNSAFSGGMTELNVSPLLGTNPQAPWPQRGFLGAGYLQDNGYNTLAMAVTPQFSMGSSAALPNFNFEVLGRGITVKGDADPTVVIKDILTNAISCLGLPASYVGGLTPYLNYTTAFNLKMTVTLTEQTDAASILTDITTYTNTDVFVSQGVFQFAPRGDTSTVGYVAPAPVFDLTEDHFIPQDSGDPVTIQRKDPADLVTQVTIECQDRSRAYVPALVKATDQALIQQIGSRPDQSRQMNYFKDPSIALLSAQLLLQRQAIMNTYVFKLPPGFWWLDPCDIVTLTTTSGRLPISAQPVKILTMAESDDGTWDFTAEEYGVGTGTAAGGTAPGGDGTEPNTNVSPGEVTASKIFELPGAYNQSAVVYVAAAGTDPNYGGCQVFVSTDGSQFDFVAQINGRSRIGTVVRSNNGGSHPFFAVGGTDSSSAPVIDLSESLGELTSVSQSSFDALSTVFYVDNVHETLAGGEIVAYRDAALINVNLYGLTTMKRGLFGTTPRVHDANDNFVRLDGNVAQVPYVQGQIGTPIFIKLCAFNIYGNALQALADVDPISYTVQGLSFSQPTSVPTTVTQSEMDQVRSQIGALEIAVAKSLNKVVLLQSSGNDYVDPFETSAGLDLVLSNGMVLDRANGFIQPSVDASGLISRGAGAIIGNMSGGNYAFDGLKGGKKGSLALAIKGLVHPNAGEATWLGKDFGVSPKKIKSVKIYGTTDAGFGIASSNPISNIVFRLYGISLSDPLPQTPTGGTLISAALNSFTPSKGVFNTSAGVVVNSLNVTQAYRAVWATMEWRGPFPSNVDMVITEMEITEAAGTVSNMTAISAIIPSPINVTAVMFQAQLEMIDPIQVGVDLTVDVAADATEVVIAGITKANPAVVSTVLPHGLSNGVKVYIGGAKGMTEVNGLEYTIANKTSNGFQLLGVDSTLFGTYTANSAKVLNASWTQMPLADITGSIGGNNRALQSSVQALSVPGKNLIYRARSINGKNYKIHGVQIVRNPN